MGPDRGCQASVLMVMGGAVIVKEEDGDREGLPDGRAVLGKDAQ